MSKTFVILPLLAALGACSGVDRGNGNVTESKASLTEQSTQSGDKSKRGWFAFKAKTNDVSGQASEPAADVAAPLPSGPLSFGEVRKLCGKDARVAGKIVNSLPGGIKIIDSNPKATGARPFYIKGLNDKCAREISAALIEVGPPSTYEFMRLNGPKSQKLGRTDAAYDTIKTKTCGVSKSQPCGTKIAQLDRNTAFVTYYKTFGSSRQWANLLIHKGALIASDVKGK